MSVVFENPENILELIKSANSFHGLTCDELMNCDSAIAWFRNVDCPEFKTGLEVFRGNLDRMLEWFNGTYQSSMTQISELKDPMEKNSLFIELLPLLAGFDIAVLAFAAQFLLQIQEKYTSSFKLRSVSSGLTNLFRDFVLISIVSLVLFLWSIRLIFTLIDFIFGGGRYKKGIAQGGNINETFLDSLIGELDKKMLLELKEVDDE